jgi:hypothetical protein
MFTNIERRAGKNGRGVALVNCVVPRKQWTYVGTLKIGYLHIQALSQDKEQGVHARAAT